MPKPIPTIRCETCNKLVHTHKKCKYCTLLLHKKEKCDCNHLKIRKLLKPNCIICKKKHRGDKNKQLKRFLIRGNWCRKCEIKANRNAINFTPTIIFREGFERTETIKPTTEEKPSTLGRKKLETKNILKVNETEYFYPNNETIKQANEYKTQHPHN